MVVVFVVVFANFAVASFGCYVIWCPDSLAMNEILSVYFHLIHRLFDSQAITAGYFYHTARLGKSGQYRTVKHQQVSGQMTRLSHCMLTGIGPD